MGNRSKTNGDKTCIAWDKAPVQFNFQEHIYVGIYNGVCRNPAGFAEQPFCLTIAYPYAGYCDVPYCGKYTASRVWIGVFHLFSHNDFIIPIALFQHSFVCSICGLNQLDIMFFIILSLHKFSLYIKLWLI